MWGRIEDPERGDALVLVISFIFVIGILISLLTSIVVSSSAKATSTRANGQAVAAAEGGAEAYLQKMVRSTSEFLECYDPGVNNYDTVGAAVRYEVLGTKYRTKASTVWQDCDSATQVKTKNVDSLMVKVKGIANTPSRNDDAANEAVIERVLESPDGSPFNEAVFGDQGITTSSNLKLLPDDQVPAGSTAPSPDLVTKGQWYCPSSSDIAGSIYALGGGTTNSTCKIQGNLYVNGDFKVPSQLTVSGNLYVNGNLTTNSGNLHVGTAAKPGLLLVRGNYEMNQADTIYGDIRATGTFTTTDVSALSKLSGHMYLGKGKKTDSNYNLNQVFINYASKITSNLEDTQGALAGDEWKLPTIMEENTRTPEESKKLEYPFIFRDNSIFDGYTAKSYADFVAESGAQENGVCSAYAYNKVIEVNAPTIFDLSECDLKKSAGTLTFSLKADAAIYVKSFTNSSGTIKVVNGDDASSTRRYSLMIIARPKANQDTCIGATSASTQSRIVLSSGTLDQKDATGKVRTKVLLYSAGWTEVNSINMDSFYGQVYGCTVYVPTTQNFRFSKVGEDLFNDLRDLHTRWVRDITN